MSKTTKKAREFAVHEKIKEMYAWYLSNNFQVPPDTLCVDEKAYRGKVLCWLDPPLKDMENPVLIEEYIGDEWTLRFEVRNR